MLTTNLRSTQTLDPCIGVARAAVVECARPRSVTASAYRCTATSRPFTAAGTFAGVVSTGAAWSANGHTSMSKIDLHPDRWPLHSTS